MFSADRIQALIEAGLPDCTARVVDPANDGAHFQAEVTSPAFSTSSTTTMGFAIPLLRMASSGLPAPAEAQPRWVPLTENPDILAGIGNHETLRPRLVIGFAAETDKLIEHGTAKLKRKGADYIVANDVSPDSGIGGSGVMGGDRNRITLLSPGGAEEWPEMGKDEVAARLAALVADILA